MSNFHTLDIEFSHYHLIFPIAIGAILVVLLIVMAAKGLTGWLTRSSNSTGQRFRLFDKGFDWKKLFGTVVLLLVYALVLVPLGFVVASIAFMLVISFIYKPDINRRSLIAIAANAFCTPVIIWLVFGQLFDITLP